MPDNQLQRDEVQALLDAANALKIPADTLKPVNPFRSDMKSPTAQTIQMWLRENRPDIAARMSGNSGHVFSLAATASGIRSAAARCQKPSGDDGEL